MGDTDSFEFKGVKYVCLGVGENEGAVGNVLVIGSNGLISDHLDIFWNIPVFKSFMELFSKNLMLLIEKALEEHEAHTNKPLSSLEKALMILPIGASFEARALCDTIKTIESDQEAIVEEVIKVLKRRRIVWEEPT